MAKLAMVMANGGEARGVRIMSERTWELFHSEAKAESEAPFGNRTAFTKGGVHAYGDAAQQTEINPALEVPEATKEAEWQLNLNRAGWFGWMGLGGSILQWHPEHKVGFAYAGTHLLAADLVNRRIG